METRTFDLREIGGKLNTETLLAEIAAKTGLQAGEVALAINQGGQVERIVTLDGVTTIQVETMPPTLQLTLKDQTLFGKALEAIQAHAPQKDDVEMVATKEADAFNERLTNAPVIQEILAALQELQGK
jgi:hypothetical protein